MPDGLLMLDNIIAGKTVLGHDTPFFHPMDFAKDHQIRMVTGAALDISARIVGDFADAGQEWDFSNFARKIACYANRGGTLAEHPSFLTRVTHAANFVRDKPRMMRGGIAIPALVDLALHAHLKRSQDFQPKTHAEEIVEMEAKARPPQPPVVWQSDNRHYQLMEFAHPFHVWEEGMVLNNCLCRINPYLEATRVRSSSPPDTLWALQYWKEIEDRQLRIFSLRSGTARIATLGLYGGKLREVSIRFPDEPGLAAMLADIVGHLQDRVGPIKLISSNIPPNARAIMRQVRTLREQRGEARA